MDWQLARTVEVRRTSAVILKVFILKREREGYIKGHKVFKREMELYIPWPMTLKP